MMIAAAQPERGKLRRRQNAGSEQGRAQLDNNNSCDSTGTVEFFDVCYWINFSPAGDFFCASAILAKDSELSIEAFFFIRASSGHHSCYSPIYKDFIDRICQVFSYVNTTYILQCARVQKLVMLLVSRREGRGWSQMMWNCSSNDLYPLIPWISLL